MVAVKVAVNRFMSSLVSFTFTLAFLFRGGTRLSQMLFLWMSRHRTVSAGDRVSTSATKEGHTMDSHLGVDPLVVE